MKASADMMKSGKINDPFYMGDAPCIRDRDTNEIYQFTFN